MPHKHLHLDAGGVNACREGGHACREGVNACPISISISTPAVGMRPGGGSSMHPPCARMHVCIPSRVWHVHRMYAQVGMTGGQHIVASFRDGGVLTGCALKTRECNANAIDPLTQCAAPRASASAHGVRREGMLPGSWDVTGQLGDADTPHAFTPRRLRRGRVHSHRAAAGRRACRGRYAKGKMMRNTKIVKPQTANKGTFPWSVQTLLPQDDSLPPFYHPLP